MGFTLKQFVPSSVCLKCDGCCRFKLSDSAWRPKTGDGELTQGVDAKGYVEAVSYKDHYKCTFFNPTDNTCGIYAKRPFECSLYPFILSQSERGLELYMHLACPYIQDKEISPELQEYAAYLKTFFSQPQTQSFLKENGRLLHDYTAFKDELKFLFALN